MLGVIEHRASYQQCAERAFRNVFNRRHIVAKMNDGGDHKGAVKEHRRAIRHYYRATQDRPV